MIRLAAVKQPEIETGLEPVFLSEETMRDRYQFFGLF